MQSLKFRKPQCHSQRSAMSRPASLLLLLLCVLPLTASFTPFTCPPALSCHCYASFENQHKIHCTSNSTATATSAFDVTIQAEELVRIQCEDSPDWSRFLPGSAVHVGPVRNFVFAACAPPGPEYARRLVDAQLGVREVEYLKYEGLRAELSAEDLEVFPEVKQLVLLNNRLGEVEADLLRGLPHLKQLMLRNTSIQIPRGFFSRASALKTLELSDNKMKVLAPGTFDGLKKIELLNLWKNDFREFEPTVFRGLDSLLSLDIHHNNLRTLPVDVFADLKNLLTINFSWNNFTSLPAGLFRHNHRLKYVKLLYNKGNLTELPAGMLANLADLKVATFMRSGLFRLPEDLLWGSDSLLELNLNKNYLGALPAKLLRDAVELHTLGLSFNGLQVLPEGLFKNTGKLAKLDLSRNRLKFIGERTFIGLESLQELNMENNDLSFIHIDAFLSFEELKIAKFSNNQLTLQNSVSDVFGQLSPFHPCSLLEELYLDHNNITQMHSDWVISSTKLRKLDLSYNSFDILDTQDLSFISDHVTVDLRHNTISLIDLSRLEHISLNSTPSTRNVSIHLASNPLQCDCDLYDLLRYLERDMCPSALTYINLDLESATCDGPEYLRGSSLAELSARNLKCLVETEEPRAGDPCAPDGACDCWLRPADRALMLDCADRNLTDAPEWIDARGVDRVELDLGMNQLSAPPSMRGKGYDKVTSLNLAGNRIGEIQESLFTTNLKVLNLDGNNLTSIDSKVLQKLSNSSHIIKLTLQDNPWRCDCSSRDLLFFVQFKFLDIPDLRNITCSGTNVSLSNTSIDELCPNSNRLVVILCSLLGLFGLLLGCAAALYFRFQRQIKIWLYSKNLCLCLVTEDEIDRDKTYDAFISYSHKDEEFVVQELVARLEEGPKPYKLCIHIRDWLAGEWIPNQISRSVEESRRTIVVLSPNFIESVWGRMEFQAAHKQALSEKRARVIVVVYGEIELTDNLDPELRAYLQMNTYVKWGDPWFWQKLRYAMPHKVGLPKKIDLERNDSSQSIMSGSFNEKKIEEMNIMFVDETEKCQGIVETVREISRNFTEKSNADNQDKWCLTL